MIGVIGDIHGCYYTFLKLIDLINEKYRNIDLFCVGDLVDRGNFSHLVVQYFSEHDIRSVLGNHDCLFYYSFFYPNHPYRLVWAANGNQKTLSAYAGSQELLVQHADFLKNLPLFYNVENCFISHAGISVLLSYNLKDYRNWNLNQWNSFLFNYLESEIGILWNRTSLVQMEELQVVGHTRHMEVTYTGNSNTVYIDTAACAGNKLSSVIIEKGRIIDQVSVLTLPEDIF